MFRKLLIPLGVILFFLLVFFISFITSIISLKKNSPAVNKKSPIAIKDVNTEVKTTNSLPLVIPKVPESNVSPADADKDTAIPDRSIPVLANSPSKKRLFNISMKENVYSSTKIVVNEGDVININFTAVDKKYDLSFLDFGIRQDAFSGETKMLEFQATTQGSFPYICNICNDQKSRGELIIVPRP